MTQADCIYLAHAESARAPLITADDRLVEQLTRRRGVRVVSLPAL